jgi:hypothetical protein
MTMNSRLTFSLLVATAFFSAVQPMSAASKKEFQRQEALRSEALVAALQQVSPDPLGGRLGLNLAIDLAPKTTSPATQSLAKVSDRGADRRGYLSWKRAKKS